MDKLKQMEALVAAVDAGSLAKAAQALDVTPAMLGRRVNALERRLGVKLLHRSTRHLSLTEQGSVFVERCRKLLAELAASEEMMSAGRQRATGHLRITAPAGFGRRHVAPHAPSFLAKNPEVQISIDLTDRVVDLTREGHDLGIRIGSVLDPNLVALRLWPNQRLVCASPRYLKRHGTPRTPAELQQHNCLAFNPQGGQQGGWSFQDKGRQVTIRVRGNPDCNDGELLHLWARQGLGLAWRSTWEIQADIERGELVTVLDEYALPDYDIRAMYPQQAHVPAKVRFFVEHLRKVYSKPGYWSA
ncbi:MAG TPA: LysR family transcriptional regulator [Rhodocyclaceae bacterium]|nr:LysR family transcriptional regulator [Rhodocyclaceae bacterium]